MTPFFDDGQVTLYQGHVLDVLRGLPDESVQCVVTSPPYWALRSYGTEAQVWGGDPVHTHEWASSIRELQKGTVSEKQSTHKGNNGLRFIATESRCPCGAWRGELGHEPTPQMFVAHLVEVFREVRRVLKSDGVCFVNIGDSYAGSGKGPSNSLQRPASSMNDKQLEAGAVPTQWLPIAAGLKSKDLVLIPERFALAMQDDGWYIRSRIAWCKRAPMPESVRDRPTNAWEHIWMLTKSSRYYWDADAVRETATAVGGGGWSKAYIDAQTQHGAIRLERPEATGSRNMWSYWLLSPDPEPLAHFATFPREIPRRCIAAATSDKGECPKCGKPWVRVVETFRNGRDWNKNNRAGGDRMQVGQSASDAMPKDYIAPITTGWAPQCAHDLPPVPQTVLDPFCGSGTTSLVARSMLRRSIGIDISEPYLRDIALKKNAQMAMMPPVLEEPA